MTNEAADLARPIAPPVAANERTYDLLGLAGADVEHDALAIVCRDVEPAIAGADGGGEELAPLHVVSRVHPQDGSGVRHQVRAVRSRDHDHRVRRRMQVRDGVNALRSDDGILIVDDGIDRGGDGRTDLAHRLGRTPVPNYHAPVRAPGDHRQEAITVTAVPQCGGREDDVAAAIHVRLVSAEFLQHSRREQSELSARRVVTPR